MRAYKRLVFYDIEPSHVTERTPLLQSIIAYVRFSSLFSLDANCIEYACSYCFYIKNGLFTIKRDIYKSNTSYCCLISIKESRRNTEIYIST